MPVQPDRERDVIVRHMKDESARVESWAVFVGRAKRADLPTADGALLFARLLADLQQRRAWVMHGDDSDLAPLDHATLRGCSCC